MVSQMAMVRSGATIVALIVRYGLVLLFLPCSAFDKIFGAQSRGSSGAADVQRPQRRHSDDPVRSPSAPRGCWLARVI